jgi:hypothetical protein
MATITEDYVSFETAKLLKEKGFDNVCSGYYNQERVLQRLSACSIKDTLRSPFYFDCMPAPTHQMAMKWLREVHNVFISITYEKWDGVFIADVKSPVSGIDCWVDNKHNCWFKYEEAAEEAIKFCLKRII